jgi:phosphohistidine phosphatase
MDWLLVDIGRSTIARTPAFGKSFARRSPHSFRHRACEKRDASRDPILLCESTKASPATTGAGSRPYDAVVRVVLVRHAEAAPGEPDELRPLTPQGREQARALARVVPRPNAIVSSPLLRARETAEVLGVAVGVTAETDQRLAPGATAADVLGAAAGRGETVIVVAHQPDCGVIAAALGGGEVAFPPGSHCVLDV